MRYTRLNEADEEVLYAPYDFSNMSKEDLLRFVGKAVYPGNNPSNIMSITGINRLADGAVICIGQDIKCTPEELATYRNADDDTPCAERKE